VVRGSSQSSRQFAAHDRVASSIEQAPFLSQAC
jgi:hypothetical protein